MSDSMEELFHLVRDTLDIDLPLYPDTPLLTSGIVDSLGVVLLLTAIEDSYEVEIAEAQIGADNFDTPRQILECIRKAQEAA